MFLQEESLQGSSCPIFNSSRTTSELLEITVGFYSLGWPQFKLWSTHRLPSGISVLIWVIILLTCTAVGWMRLSPMGSDTWFLVSGTVWIGLGDVFLMEEVWQCGQDSFQLAFSPLWFKMWPVRLLLQPPWLLPHFPLWWWWSLWNITTKKAVAWYSITTTGKQLIYVLCIKPSECHPVKIQPEKLYIY